MSHKKAPELRQGHANEGPAAGESVAVTPLEEAPPAPEHLDRNGRFLWDEVWQAGGSFYQVHTDGATIERYCSLQSRRLTILAALENEGWLSVGSQGQEILHPLARVLNDIEGKLVALEDRLGLSPQARMNLGISAAAAQNALDDFLKE